jgi:hypothetical protein
MATQMTISIEGTTPMLEGEIMPTWGTKSTPASPALAAEVTKTSVLIITGS